ncbi:MAG: signal peptidase I [Myxococcota bacterium]|nr:signal peptidase I [Myxococcota bacterium]
MTESNAENVSDDKDEEQREMTFGEKVWEQVSTLGLAILIALAIRNFVVEPFRIPSGSMLPTLLIGDHLFVNKFAYGAQIPLTDIRLPGMRDPERGDVVVFRVARGPGHVIAPIDAEPDWPQEDFVKRIIGLPGERVEVRSGGVVYVNGQRMDRDFDNRTFVDERGRTTKVGVESLGECKHLVLDLPGAPSATRSAFTLPDGRYFMMGDNRDNSRDSRDWGTVHFDDLKGPAFVLYWSWNHAGNFMAFLNPVNWFKIPKRWDRVLKGVECGDLEAPAEAGLLNLGRADAPGPTLQNIG